MMTERGVVVIGGGQAGASCVFRLRARGYEGPVTLVCGEPEPPYQRPPLSKKYLTGEYARERLFLRPQASYGELGIALMLGRQAVAIDRQRREVRLDDGRTLAYEALVLATGARARALPPALADGFENLYPFRTLADTRALQDEMQAGRRLLVIGGGYIGLETAAVARQLGLDVVLVEQAPRILQRVAAPETSDVFRSLHRAHGVNIIEGRAALRLEGEGARARAAVLDDGRRLDFDLAVVGIGIVPETTLAQDAGLQVDGGIVVDENARTSDAAILAAGDCTVFPYRGEKVRLESVQNAIDQAEHAADVICGVAEGPYRPVPWFWSDQYDTKLQIAGLNRGHDAVITRPGRREGSLSVWYLSQGRFIAVDAINEPRAYMLGKRWLETGVAPDPARLADPAIELKNAA